MKLVSAPARFGAERVGFGERAEEERVEATEASEGEDHRTQLLLPAPCVCPLLGAYQLPQPLVPRGFVPLLADAPSLSQRLRVHVLQHLQQNVVV
ncbi:hypothetical protein Fmac_032366 [Flemingia macrophylla]|uniref:Uncharacterized protein n=1 Tax=Flemingia macrophylla TaxID=520843 RepID=A0ABD1L4Q1_9FABA